MLRSDLLQEMCNRYPSIIRSDMEKIISLIFHEILEALCRGQEIHLRNFGILKTTLRKARMGRNPKNGAVVKISQKRHIKWKTGKAFFNRLNKNFTGNKISANY